MSVLPPDDELRSEPLYPAPARGGIERREFLQALSGLAVLCLVAPGSAQPGRQSGAGPGESGTGAQPAGGDPSRDQLSSWLHVAENGTITVYTGKVEVGQGIRTSLAQVVAEELRVPYTTPLLIMGDTDLVPYDAGTFGSQTTPRMAPVLRSAAAAARELLLDLAAEQWHTDRAKLQLADGVVTDPAGGHKAGYGELVKGRKLVHTISGAPVTPATEWRVAGQSEVNVRGHDVVTGAHHFPADLTRPGMLHGRVVRPAGFGAHLQAADTAAAERLPGVKVVRDGDFLAVTAPNESLAEQAADAVKAQWDVPAQPSEQDLIKVLRPAPVARLSDPTSTSVADGLAAADLKLEATYTVAYIAHVPLEPRSAVAEWGQDGRLTVWTGTQRPFGVRDELAKAFGLPVDRVHVLMPDTGSGYGGKHTGETAIEAARLARATGRPVKVLWSREEEFTWAYFRPAGVIDVLSGVKRDGTLTAWEFHNHNSGPAGLDTPYEVQQKKVQFHQAPSPLRQGSYRGLAAPANFFARETHMDELARALGQDPLAFRLHNLRNERVRAVLATAAERFGWGTKPAEGHAYGLACGTEKGGYVATCVDVTLDSRTKRVRVARVLTAYEAGALISPDNTRNQAEGAVVQGLGGALFEAIHFADGKILNPLLSQYRVPRFRDLPAIEIVLLDRKDLPSAGAGETPIMALAPAIGAALFTLTGERLRSLPLVPKQAG